LSPWPDLVFAAAAYAALALLAGGIAWRISAWLRTPSRRRVPVTPAPRSRAGVVWRMVHETLLFTTLLRASPWTWLFGWCFHLGLALVLLQHLRYVTEGWWGWVGWLAAHGHVASALLVFGLAGLWLRRLLVDRVRFVTRPSDHAVLALLAAIAASGIALKYLAPVNVLAVKGFARGVLGLAPQPLPEHGLLLVHVALALVLIALFPYGKLMHGPGLWLNPTRARPDDARRPRAGGGYPPAHGR